MTKLIAIAAMSLLLGLSACGDGGESSGINYPRGISADTIKIGSHTDLSGPIAIWGVPMVNGDALAFSPVETIGFYPLTNGIIRKFQC